MPRCTSSTWSPSSSTIRYFARRDSFTIRRPATAPPKSAVTRRRSRFSPIRTLTIVLPTAVRTSIRRSDSTSGSSGIARDDPAVQFDPQRMRESQKIGYPQFLRARPRIDRGAFERAHGLHAVNSKRMAERVANRLARRGKRCAHGFEHVALVTGRERRRRQRREGENFSVNLGTRMEAAGRDGEMQIDLPVERGEYAQRAVRVVAGACADSRGNLALEHQHHSRDRARVIAQPAQNRRRDIEGEIADYLDPRIARECREIEREKIGVNHADIREALLEPGRKARVELHQRQRASWPRRDFLSQDAEAGTDLDYRIRFAKLRRRDDSIRYAGAGEKILAARFRRPHAHSRERCCGTRRSFISRARCSCDRHL